MDEAKALELCRTKVKQRKLPMEVIDAEYQWYAISSQRLAEVIQAFFLGIDGNLHSTSLRRSVLISASLSVSSSGESRSFSVVVRHLTSCMQSVQNSDLDGITWWSCKPRTIRNKSKDTPSFGSKNSRMQATQALMYYYISSSCVDMRVCQIKFYGVDYSLVL